jgi:MerR family transcriptional regulator/heat shock protein HspR
MGVNKAGVDIILRMKERMEKLQEEMDEMMERLEDDMRLEFERKLRNIFNR